MTPTTLQKNQISPARRIGAYRSAPVSQPGTGWTPPIAPAGAEEKEMSDRIAYIAATLIVLSPLWIIALLAVIR